MGISGIQGYSQSTNSPEPGAIPRPLPGFAGRGEGDFWGIGSGDATADTPNPEIGQATLRIALFRNCLAAKARQFLNSIKQLLYTSTILMQHSSSLSPAIFIDRDGVIIHNRAEYVRSLKHVLLYPRSIAALAGLAESAYKIVVVTNQAGVGKGLIPLDTAAEINHRVVEAIVQAGGRVDGVYVCPHTVEDRCACRKPQPGLLTRAAADLGIDLGASYMIGDAASDVAAGQRAGVKQAILVLTGRGREQRSIAEAPFVVKRSLKDALEWITSLK
jgi:D-glycero-D-manno-heptose 1,7-bisphosphate phosphatase